MTRLKLSLFRICGLAIIVALSSCQSTLQSPRMPTESAASQRLSVSAALAEANRFLDADDLVAARATLAQITPGDLDAGTSDDYLRTVGRLHLKSGDYEQAQATLASLNDFRGRDYLYLGQACAALGDDDCAAEGLIQASIELGMTRAPADLNDQIWRALSGATAPPVMFTHRYHEAWWQLQRGVREATSIGAQLGVWRAWQQRFPSHPAAIRPPDMLSRLEGYRPPRVGVLLPLTGQLAAAGQAARDGFMSAYFSEDSNNRPQVTFYDANQPLAQVWERMLSDGIEVSVGPIVRSQAEAFAGLSRGATIPRLLLNYLDDSVATSLDVYQLAIAIEDEAATLVEAVRRDNQRKIALIHSEERWSRRARDEFAALWPNSLTVAAFSEIKDLTQAVGVAMQIDDSEARRREVANIVAEEVEFLPRARQDLDAIVALTDNVQTRALVPALRFHFAEHLPIYATSQSARNGSSEEFAGFNRAEMPLFFDGSPAYTEMTNAFDLTENPLVELYALGFDAYQVATWLPLLEQGHSVTLPGASGALVLDDRGRFRRQLRMGTVQEDGSLGGL